jgi:hypothetical protein
MSKLTDEQAQKVAAKQRAKDRATARVVITELMRTVDGRRWVWLQLSAAQLFTASDTTNPYEIVREQGKRTAALALLADVTTYTPEMYIRMTQENAGVQLQEEEINGGHPDSDA